MRVLPISIIVIVSFLPQDVNVSTSPRLAAIDFATRHGFEVPRSNVVVANEVRFGGGHNPPSTTEADRSRLLPLAETLADTKAIARLLGPAVRTGSAYEYVTCVKASCVASGSVSVLVVDEVKNNDPGLIIKLYSPANGEKPARVTMATVHLSKGSGGWTATRFGREPVTVVSKSEKRHE